jgi:hypothetical protein
MKCEQLYGGGGGGVGGVGGGGVGGGTNSLLFRRSCIHVRNIYGFTTENNVLKMQK